ncbi:MAG TPA: ABC transporter substrate-binding protein [Chloroflexota bacterium]|nr:ABC transporter substrate-binding protein [Chloroflexota bacterium]
MHYSRIPFLGGAVALTLALAACGGGGAAPASSAPAPASSTAAPASAAASKPAASSAASSSAKPAAGASTAASTAANGQTTKLTASYSNLVADELPVWIAKDGGYFQKNGLDVTLNYIQSSTGIPALISGETQVFQGGGSETLSAAVGGADLEIVASITPVYPFALEVPASIQNANDLKGKKLGVSSFGSSSDIATRVALDKLGLDPNKDVSILQVGSESSRISALLNGAIQGGVAQPPARYDIEAHGFHSIYDLAAQHVPSANTAVVFKKSYADAHKDVVQKYVDSIVEAIAREKSDEGFSNQVLSKYLKLDNQDYLNRTWNYYVTNIVPSLPVTNTDQFTDAVNALESRNPAVKNYDVNKLIDNEFVNNAKGLASSSAPNATGPSASAGAAGSASSAGASSAAKPAASVSSGSSPSAASAAPGTAPSSSASGY